MAPSVRQYLTLFYRSPKNTQEWNDMWVIGQSIDTTLEAAHQAHGYFGVTHCLDTDDRMEHWLSRIGAEVAYQVTGDAAMKRELLSFRAPGNAHVLPTWAVSAARDLTKQQYLQAGRVASAKGAGRGAAQDEDARVLQRVELKVGAAHRLAHLQPG